MAYIEITDSEIDPESPITTGLMARLRDNPLEIALGATGAPRIQTGGIADGAITTPKFGTITNIAVTSDPTTGDHLTRRSFTDGRYLRKDSGGGSQIVESVVTFASSTTHEQQVLIGGAGNTLLFTGGGRIESRPGAGDPSVRWNIAGMARGTTGTVPTLSSVGILGTPTGSTGNMTIPFTRSPASGYTFLAQVTSRRQDVHISAEYRSGNNEILIDADISEVTFDLTVWEVNL